jgi:probable metal-binding protein
MTNTEIHGHEAIALIRALPAPLDRAALVQLIEEHFGHAARFFTCSASGMTAAGLIAFLVERGKLASRGGQLVFDPSRSCGH